ncbi:MAG: putative endonuclease distantly related to archaeal Holliday junction resolvase, YraN/UPF0102 family [Candidatus Midichloria mitochondrii]|uniref:YraN family protein n=1 Tax=Midichloria mitochondrii (strain IricVA) TaxID=696127 RepID=F7XV03_MIDMI|nr:YraN family protein [Candidatus Midichloria mitochondrii]AEI88502.1 hypothetical protein midi_00182 [Candidatus Midichloria mitochondrii IricVA]MDJ1256264.1 YraN family protein [Candidatus Midichloria mitochondrii]MDJ1287961.1 YraN family protein [Candidatus Midichloria mitochondrii]MDJ1298806.1 YraN family protein [Candidatus Midichloria mitochondrii]MDJ1313012.1 YraN family protein [Candidatus Midichloria mitochondrii]
MQKSNYRVGIEAEELVERYLIDLGYKIIKKRWKGKFGEIDIIAIQAHSLLFVEVKCRKNYLTNEVIFTKQQKRNSLAALDFLSLKSIRMQKS